MTGTARTLVDRADWLSYRALRGLADAPRAFPKAELQRVHARLPGRAGWSRTQRLILELDSRAHHARRREMLEDKRRDRRYLLAGSTPVRLMWEELDPDDPFVARELRRVLAGGYGASGFSRRSRPRPVTSSRAA